MNKIILSTLLLSAFSAFANEAGDDLHNLATFQGEHVRAEVHADYLRARATGVLVDTSEAASLESQTVGKSLPRGSHRAEAIEAARTRVIHELM